MDNVVRETSGVILVVKKNRERVAVETVQPLKGRKPDVAFSVLTDGKNSVLRQTVIY